MGRITYRFENNGDTIVLDNNSATDYTKAVGASGFGIAPTTIDLQQGAREGSRFGGSRREAREMTIPMYFFGTTGQEIEDKMRRLVRLLNDTYTSPKLVAEYPDGSEFEIEVHYKNGGDLSSGIDTNGRDYAKWPMVFVAPRPYFIAREPVQLSLRAANAGRGLIRTGNGGLTRLRLSSSQAVGVFSVENPGDVESPAIWTLVGPSDGFIATRVRDGASWEFENGIEANETITIDTQTKLVTDQLGENRYGDLGFAPKLFAIPQGDSTINVVMSNATTASIVSLYFLPRRELVFG